MNGKKEVEVEAKMNNNVRVMMFPNDFLAEVGFYSLNKFIFS